MFHRFMRFFVFFFFTQKTAYELRFSDWSSDVCSSDLDDSLCPPAGPPPASGRHPLRPQPPRALPPGRRAPPDRRGRPFGAAAAPRRLQRMAVAASHPARHLQPRRRLDPACELSRPSAALCPRPHLLPSGRPARWQPGGPRGARGLRPPAGAGGALSAGPALLKVTALEVSPGALASTPWRRLHGRG